MLNIAHLKTIPILAKLSEADLHSLAQIAGECHFAAGTNIFLEGSEDNSLFVILSGDVLITKRTASGAEKAIATLSEGGFFGEMALFDDFLRSATATAATNVRAFQISRNAFMRYLADAASGASMLLLEIMRVLAPRIRQTNLELVSLYEAGRIIGEHAEIGMMLSGLLAVLTEGTSCTRGAAFLLNSASGMLECRAAFGYESDPSGWTESRAGGIAEEILRIEGAVVVENFPVQKRFQSLHPIGYETSSMLGAALRVRRDPIGMIILCDKVDRQGQPAHFTSGDANILAGITAQASGAIDSARLHEEAREKEKLDRVYFRF